LEPLEKTCEDRNFSCRTVLIRFESRGWPHHAIWASVAPLLSDGTAGRGNPLSLGDRPFAAPQVGLLSRILHADLFFELSR
jgi:hypothetical protein